MFQLAVKKFVDRSFSARATKEAVVVKDDYSANGHS